MARTLVTGNILRSGSIPTTALGGGVVTSSLQIVASLPTGSLSSSAQVNYPDISNIPGGIASSSAQIKDYLPVDTVSSSAQVTAYLPTGTVSSSGQISVFNTINGDQLATTGSNTFTAPQTISDTTNSTSYLDGALHVAGGMSVRKDVRVSGSMTVNGLLTAVSMSTQYVTSSEYVVGTSRITLNDDDNVRFAGLSIIDSGSSSPTSASIFWDSLQHRFIYENLSGSAYNSSIIIAGPKHTGTLGDEPTLTSGYIPYATGTDHIDNSVMFQSSSRIGIGSTNPSYPLDVRGSVGGYAASFGGATYQLRIYTDTAQAQINDGVGQYIQFRSDSTFMTFATNNAERLRIDANGNLGLGVTPSAWSSTNASVLQLKNTSISGLLDNDLHLSSNAYWNGSIWIRIAASVRPANYYQSAGTHNWRTSVTGSVGSTISWTDAMTLDASGNLGIGTTNPVARLRVFTDSADTQVRIGNNAAYDQFIYFNGTADWAMGIDNSNANAFKISRYSGLGTNDIITISTGSNVGIGTTNPRTALNVAAAATIDTAGADNKWTLRLQDTTSATTNVGGSILFQGYKTTTSAIGNFAGIAGLKENSTGGNENGYLAFYTTPNATGLLNERMRIDSSGNVGINTTGPEARLHVVDTNGQDGTIKLGGSESALGLVISYSQASATTTQIISNPTYTNSSAAMILRVDGDASATANQLYLRGDGFVGIGIASPSTKLTVSANSTDVANGQIRAVGASDSAKMLAMGYHTTDNYGYVTALRAGIGYSPLILNGEGGNVGIGLTNPVNALDVKGIFGAPSTSGTAQNGIARFGQTSGGGILDIGFGDPYSWMQSRNSSNYATNYSLSLNPNGGNVGIGSTNPGYKLDVAGSLNATSIRQITTTDVGNKYGRKVVGAQSSFDNPVVNLATVGNASNFVLIFRITVFQSVIAGNYGNVQVGYAYARAGNNEVTSMTIQQTIGSATAGTLSWSGSTLRFTPVRYGNYDVYNIIVELSGEDNLSSF